MVHCIAMYQPYSLVADVRSTCIALVIDCGTPSTISGAEVVTTTTTLYQTKFTVDCRALYSQEGSTNHTDGSNVVECGPDGRWKFGTIRCEGKFEMFISSAIISCNSYINTRN